MKDPELQVCGSKLLPTVLLLSGLENLSESPPKALRNFMQNYPPSPDFLNHGWQTAIHGKKTKKRRWSDETIEGVPLCGGELVEKLLKGGVKTAIVKVKAEVCLQCGGRLHPEATVRRFGRIRHKLATEDVAEFHLLGQTDQVA